MDLGTVATAFALIFPVELPDKTFVATLVLATRYRPLLVWIGVSAAFVVQCLVAVVAGGLLSLLPSALVGAVAGALFLVGAVVLWRGAASRRRRGGRRGAGGRGRRRPRSVHGFKVVATSFGVLFLAEWGDLSQLLTAGLAARYHDPVSVFVGSWLALVTVAGLAVVLGRTLLRFVRLVDDPPGRRRRVPPAGLPRGVRRGPTSDYRAPRSEVGALGHREAQLGHHVLDLGVDAAGVEQLVRPGRDALGGEPGVVVLDHRDRRERLVELDRVALHAEHLAADAARGVAAQVGDQRRHVVRVPEVERLAPRRRPTGP